MQKNIHENPQVLQQIEWDSILIKLKNTVHFEHTHQKILTYLNDTAEINEKLFKTKIFEEYQYENDFRGFVSDIHRLREDFNFSEKLTQIFKEMALGIKELNQFAISLEVFLTHNKLIKRYFNEDLVDEDFNSFKRKCEKSFLIDFRKFVSIDGEIDLSKHPKIRPLYEKQLALESKIRGILNNSLREGNLAKISQFSTIDVIHDRYVVPIRSDSYNGQIGQIISRSESGNTLYVEPKNVSQLNFSRIEIIIEIQNILARLELDLTKALKPLIDDLARIINFYMYCDEFNSRVAFARELNLNCPELAYTREIDLKNCFHPLIEKPVKNDIHLTPDKSGIIISGPNTGGKTATLKTLALIQIFIRYGLYIPADHGKIFPYESVFYFGNDQQNLDQGLSSFSAEVKNYSELFDSLKNSNLILIDEIFNSTSSEEASALAIAFFQEMEKVANIHVVVSSHHQTLKTILHQDDQYISAHVGFDSDTNNPTYKLHFGTPGSSHALKIFQKLTHNREHFENIYNNSLNFLDNKVIHYEKLLESIAEKENKLNKTLLENSDLNNQLKNQKNAMDGVLKLKVQERVEKAEKKIASLLSKAEAALRETRKGSINKNKTLQNEFSQINSEVKKLRPLKEEEPKKTYDNLSKPEKYIEGNEYFCLTLEKTVTLKRIERNKKKALVTSGIISMKVDTSSLMLANAPKKHHVEQPVHTYTSSKETKIEYDCRGMRLEEFQNLIEDITGNLLLGEMPYVSIIHGHGTGVLKKWLRKYVKNHKDLSSIPDETGNDGETRFKLI